ncbi:hypothetical protein NC796_25505 [Aliifodinibius sp. S!AR15-10]|nr:hypothetical protein [Aliifodinibius sp. S!AR15-10]
MVLWAYVCCMQDIDALGELKPERQYKTGETKLSSEGITYLGNVYQSEQSEFLQSKDPLFRPTDIAIAPDGTMYIVDMYRGIIQQGNWNQEGSCLRTKIKQYQL